jgi:chemotaxis protein CheC
MLSPDMLELDDMERDALTEVFNIGVGQAASAMSQMVNDRVELSVPSISFTSRAAAALELTHDAGQRICGVSQRFQGTFEADAILMFPENKSLEIVRLMIGDDMPIEELTAMEQEALTEIGNIILNAQIGTLANVFGSEFSSSLPAFHFGTSSEILQAERKNADDLVMLLHVDFKLETHQINGYVAFLLDISSVQGLRDSINRFMGNIAH